MREDFPAPPHVPDYELLREIGRGSYGVVWLARSVTGLFRAVKIVARASFDEPQPYEREFRGIREFARISLNTPRQLALLHVGRNDEAGFFYYVMELADDAARGRDIDPDYYEPNTLKVVHQRRGRLPTREAISLGLELAAGLAELHRHGLVHRDLKPSNIIFTGGTPKLADVGLITAARDADLTLSRVGNPGYMPPDFPGVPSADAYGLGRILYEVATGRNRDDFPALPTDLDSFPDRRELLELNEILLRACASAPASRYPDAGVLLDDLRLLQAGKSLRRLRAAERHLSRALRAAALLAVATTIAGIGAWVEHQRAARAEAERDAIARRAVYAASLSQVQRAIETADFGRARRMLDDTVAGGTSGLRGVEWRLLRSLARGDPGTVIRASGPSIDRIALSPDRRIVAVHDEQRTITLLDAPTGNELRRISGVQRLGGFSRDGQWLVGTATSPPASPARWRVASGEFETPSSSSIAVRPLAARGNEQMLAVIDARPAVRSEEAASPLTLIVWDFARRQAVLHQPLDKPDREAPWEFFRSAASPEGDHLVLASVRGRGRFSTLRLTSIQLDPEPTIHHQAMEGTLVSALCFLPGRFAWLAVESSSGRTFERSLDGASWSPSSYSLPPGTTLVEAQSDAPDRGLILACNAEARAMTGPETDAGHESFRGHGARITAVSALCDDDTFYSATQAGELSRWNLHERRAHPRLLRCWDSNSRPSQIVYSRDGKRLFAPGRNARLLELDASSLREIREIDSIHLPLWVGTKRLWGLGTAGNTLVEWDLEGGTVLRTCKIGDEPLSRAVFSEDGGKACVIAQSGVFQVIDFSSHQPSVHVVPGNYRDEWIQELSREGTYAWGANSSGSLARFALIDGAKTWSLPLPARATSIRRLAIRGWLAAALENGEIWYVDETTGVVVQRGPSGSAAAQDIEVTSDGSRLVAAGTDGALHILAPEWNSYLATIRTGIDSPLHVVAVAPDGSSVATLSKNGTLRVMEAR